MACIIQFVLAARGDEIDVVIAAQAPRSYVMADRIAKIGPRYVWHPGPHVGGQWTVEGAVVVVDPDKQMFIADSVDDALAAWRTALGTADHAELIVAAGAASRDSGGRPETP